MFQYIIFLIFIPTSIISIRYGIISQAQLISGEPNNIWLFNQSSWSQCMCQALQYKPLFIAAFNFFFHNQTCQLIPQNLSLNISFYIMSSLYSSIFILNKNITYQFKSICCVDTSWLLNKIQQENTFRNITITKPVGLALDYDLNILIITYGNTRSIQLRESTENMTSKKNLFTKTNARPISYNKGFYFIGINPSAASSSYNLYIYNTSLTYISISFPQGDPQRAIWLYNNSLMCLIIQQNQSSILAFLNWYSLSLNFTYNRTISIPFNKAYGLTKSNDDTMIYISGDLPIIYQLSTKTFIWSILVSNNNSTEIPISLFVDSCNNRLWVLMLGYGIRIYDRIYGTEIISWNMSTHYPNLYDMVLTSNYELYLIDYSMNQLIHYGSSLKGQCTIN